MFLPLVDVRMVLLLVWVALGATVVAAPGAAAAPFVVQACDAAPDGANHGFSLVETAPAGTTEAVQRCPSAVLDPLGVTAQGLAIQDVLGAGPASPDGSYREWRLAAPPSVRITGFNVRRDIGNRGTMQTGAYTPYARIDTKPVNSETCFKAKNEAFCRVTGVLSRGAIDAGELAWGIRCTGGQDCPNGTALQQVWVAVLTATVTLDDATPPSVEVPSGDLADPALWQSGTRAVTVTAADSTGIRELAVYDGDAQVTALTAPGPAAGGCAALNQGPAFTFVDPCGGSRGVGGAQTLAVDTTAFGDGTRSLRVAARDTVGNETFSPPIPIQVDNEAPAAPDAATDGTWTSADEATWTWSAPVEADRAPIASAEVERCDAAGACSTDVVTGGASPYVAAVPEGVTAARVRLVDAAGNVGAWSAETTVKRDRTAPVVSIETPGGPVEPGAKLDAGVSAQDALSGLSATERQYRVDGGAWRQMTGAIDAEGSMVRFRARAQDAVGNLSGWVESGDVSVNPVAAPSPVGGTDPAPAAQNPAPGGSTAGGGGRSVADLEPFGGLVLDLEQAMVRRKARIVGLKVRRSGAVLRITGRVRPNRARGRIVVTARVGGKAVRAERAVGRRGRFAVVVRRAAAVRRLSVRYGGDSLHRPAGRRVRVPA